MSTSVTLNAVSYTIPAQGEGNWGTNVSNYLIALSTGVLQKAGGTFTLTADVDFGATYGLKSVYFKSRNTPSTAGIVRLGNNESVGWRNAANSANLELKANASNLLEYNGSLIGILAAALTPSRALVSDGSGNVSVSSVTSTQLAYLASATGTTGTTSTNLVFSTSPTFITPTLGAASATSINKVAITAPATGSTLTIADGKTVTLSKTMTVTSADDTSTLTLAAGAQTVGGTSSGDIVTIGGTQTLTAKTLTSPSIGTDATIKAAGELRFNNAGDTFYVGFKGGNAAANKIWTLPLVDGAANQVLKTDGAATLGWATVATTVTTTRGDIIKRDVSADTRLAIGAADTVLVSDGTDPSWGLTVKSGTYTPSLTNTTNLAASTARTCMYIQVGNIVQVAGDIDVDPTSTGNIVLGISLPIASNFTTVEDAAGTAGVVNGSSDGVVEADPTNDRLTATFAMGTASNSTFCFTAMYRVK